MYTSIEELPVNIRKKYSEKAQRAYMDTFNSVFKSTQEESRSFAAAASAANKVDGIAPVQEGVLETTDREFREASFWMDGGFTEAPKRNEEKNVWEIPATLIQPGVSKNKVYYSEGWLSRFAEVMNGGKAYLNHEKKSEIKDRNSRSVEDLAGWYENVHQDSDMSVKGTLNLVETPRTEHIIKLAQANPELVGLSINARGKASRGKVNGENVMIAETVDRVYSTDIVTEAAAGGTMRFAASVELDIEQESTPEEQPTESIKESTMSDEFKQVADYLLAESAYKADVSRWLAVEEVYKSIDNEKQAKIVEGLIEKLPEDEREAYKDKSADVITAYLEGMKKVPPKAETPPVAPDKPEVKPGDEGFKRSFL